MTGWIRPMLGGFAALVISAPGASAADRSDVSLVGPRQPVQVRLVPEEEQGGAQSRVGHTTVVLRTRAARRRQLRIRYVFDEPENDVAVQLKARSGNGPVDRRADRRRGVPLAVNARDLVVVTLSFTLPRKATDMVAGRLVIVPERWRRPRHVVGPPLVLRIAGVRAEDVDVRPDPAEVELGLERIPWIYSPLSGEHTQGDKTTVILRGRGVDAAVATSEDGEVIPAILRGNGRQVVAEGKVVSATDGQVLLEIDVDEAFSAGKYEGRLVLGDSPAATTVHVTAVVRTTIWMAVFVIFLGVVVGQLVPLLLERYRLRAQLKRDLRDTVGRYAAARQESPRQDSGGMDRLIGRWAWDPSDTIDADDCARQLARTLEFTGSPKELSDLDSKVRALEEQTRRWLTVEQAAGRLRAVLDAETLPRNTKVFSGTPPAFAAAAVLARAYQMPESDEAAEARVREIDAIAAILPDAQAIWRLQGKLDALNVPTRSRAKWELHKLWPQQFTGDENAYETLRGELEEGRDTLQTLLDRVQSGFARAEAAAASTTAPMGAGDAHQSVASILGGMRRAPGDSRRALARARRRCAVWIRAAGRRSWRVLTWARRWSAELIQGLTAMAVASAVYALTLYGETWGSEEDYITAFAAGFFGRVAVDVARLQLFRPARSTKPPPPAQDDRPPDAGSDVPSDIARQAPVASQQ